MKLRARHIGGIGFLKNDTFYDLHVNSDRSYIKVDCPQDVAFDTKWLLDWFDEITHVKEDPLKEIIEAYNNGREIEYSNNNGRTWLPASTPSWSVDLMYRIKPVDPYKELKEAHARGEHIEIYKTDDRWHSIKYPQWNADASKYRVKPPPVYVPFDLSDDIVGRVVVRKNDGTRRIVIEQCSGHNEIFAGTGYLTYAALLSDYLFADGTVCGKLKELQQ